MTIINPTSQIVSNIHKPYIKKYKNTHYKCDN